MRAERPSVTARWVAACRGAAPLLPPSARLCRDPFGARVAGGAVERLLRLAERVPSLSAGAWLLRPVLRGVLYMQVRTRVLDDELLAFARDGGRQVVLLGAGVDCRAARFPVELAGARVFEVDHPATQAQKRELTRGAPGAEVRYLAWDFEREPYAELPSRLASLGHDPARPTLTLWEGVTMYLSPAAIDATVGAVRAFSAPGSRLAFTYFERERLERPTLRQRVVRRLVAIAGEPFRFGWAPPSLPAWLDERGFELVSDRATADLGRELLPPRWAARLPDERSHIAIARRRACP